MSIGVLGVGFVYLQLNISMYCTGRLALAFRMIM